MDALMDADGTLRFGSFELDVRSRELRTGAGVVRLQEQPFEILRMMLERPGAVVTRDELRHRLWPDGTFVDFEHSLNAAVKRLRAALGDDADNPRFVETLPRRGYRFIGALDGGRADDKAGDERAARGGAAVLEPERRGIAGILHRRADRGDDRAARPALPRPPGRHRALVVDGVQGHARSGRARSGRRCARITCWRAASAARAIGCGSPPAWSRPPARRISGPKPTSGT